MKKFLLALVVLLLIAAGGLWSIGLSPTDLKANLDVGTGMGAKLACSGKYISGFGEQRIREDLASYTTATNILDFDYDDANQRVSVSFWGLGKTSATNRPGLGCTLDIGDTSPLNELRVSPQPDSSADWPAGPLVDTLNNDLQRRLEEMLAEDNRAGLDTRALVVVHNGAIRAEAYAPGISPQTPLLGWSMGKSLTSVMLGYLARNNQLDVTETSVFPDWQSDERAQISIENLLQMSSGLDFSEVYAPGSDATYMLFSAPSASAVARQSQLAHPPGSHFSYSSGTTNLLSELFVTRTGGTQAALQALYHEIFAPLGMRHSILEVDPNGVFVGSSYIYSSARDWARLGLLVLNEGSLNGHIITDPDWLQRARQPNGSENDPRYGYQFWLNGGGSSPRWADLPEDAFAMQGNRAQVVMMVPSADAVLVRLGWTAGSYPLNENFAALLEQLSPSE